MKNTTAFILILVSVGLFYIFISPEYDKVLILRNQSAEYRNILQNVSSLISKRDDLLVKYQNISQTRIGELSKVLPDNVDTVTLAMNLDSIASKYNISIKSIQTVKDNQNNTQAVVKNTPTIPYNSIIMSFSFVSNYANFRKFISDIEQSLRVTDIQSITFQSTPNGIYEFQVAIKTYWLK